MPQPLEESLNTFLADSAIVAPGLRTKTKSFVDEFLRSVTPARWTRQEIVAAIDDLIVNNPAWARIVRGRSGDNYDSLGNLTIPHHQYQKFNDNNLLKVVI